MIIYQTFFQIKIDTVERYLAIVLPILTFFGYWVKRFFDFKTKKNEIKFNLFYQNKLDVIKDFFSSYSEFESAFSSNYYKLLNNRGVEFDKDWVHLKNKTVSIFSHVQLFVNSDDIKPFQSIMERNNTLIHNVLNIGMGIADHVMNSTNKGNEIHSLISNTSKLNREDLQVIAQNTKIDFGI